MNKFVSCFLLLLTALPLWAQKSTQPNIIYIFVDDLGYAELGSYGQTKIRTPHLDQLAREGMRFTQHYASTPVCAPSRCQLLTGKHSGHSYIRGNYELGGAADSLEAGQMPLHANAFTLGHLMQQAGYRTACIGKWGLGMHNTTGNPNRQGFGYFYGYLDQKQAHNHYPTHLWENDRWDTLRNPVFDVHRPFPKNIPEDEAFAYYLQGQDYAMDKMAEKAQRFIAESKPKGTQPFFLYLTFTAPHVSLQAPPAAIQEYLGQFPEQPYYGEKSYAATRYPRATYAAMITYMDKKIGEILAQLKAQGIDENTLVIFSSDNGTTSMGGTDYAYFESVGPLRGLKMDVYEGGIRMPMLARWPGKIPAGRVTDHISAQYDVMATFCELLGVRPPETDGISFLPTLLGKASRQQPHEYLYFEYPERGGQVAVRMGNWKGVKRDLRTNRQAAWEIYDLSQDISESRNLAAQHPELAARFEAIVQHEHQPTHIREWEFINPKFK